MKKKDKNKSRRRTKITFNLTAIIYHIQNKKVNEKLNKVHSLDNSKIQSTNRSNSDKTDTTNSHVHDRLLS